MDVITSTATLCSPTVPAVTTVFTPPSWCRDAIVETYGVRGSYVDRSSLASCYPGPPIPSDPVNWTRDPAYPYHPYYSPAICPSGYSVACSRLNNGASWDPLPKASETAALCCPSGFSCDPHPRQAGSCISGARFETSSNLLTTYTRHSFSAKGVQIRWQSSDAPAFEKPPLTPAPPGKPSRFGWDPAGSLPSLYSCPAPSDSTTGTCGTLTGNYYSPAICPLGWTAAHSRSFTKSMLGPPEAERETAMFCCPSGFSSVEGVNCYFSDCVSTTTFNGTAKVAAVTEAIQIRWAATDLPLLETHPLTPGARFERATTKPGATWPRSTARPTSQFPPSRSTTTTQALPGLDKALQLGLGLCFLPILFAICLIGGCVALANKKSSGQKEFVPGILTWQALTMLVAVLLTLVAVLEISYLALPTTSDIEKSHTKEIRPRNAGAIIYPNKVKAYPRANLDNDGAGACTVITMAIISEVLVTATNTLSRTGVSTETSICNVTRTTATSYAWNRGLTYTIVSSWDIPGLCSDAYTPSLSISRSPKQTLTCRRATEAAVGFLWYQLGATTITPASITSTATKTPGLNPDSDDANDPLNPSGTASSVYAITPSDYFIITFLPTLVAVLLVVPFGILHLHTASMSPFRRLTQFVASGAEPPPAEIQSVFQSHTGLAALFAALQGADYPVAVTSCLELLAAAVAPLAAESVELGFVGSCTEDNFQGCAGVGVVSRPVVRTLQALLVAMAVLTLVLLVLGRGQRSGVAGDPRSILGVAMLAKSARYGSLLARADVVGGDGRGGEARERRRVEDGYKRQTFWMLVLFMALLVGLTVLVVTYAYTSGDTGFERFMSGQGFGVRFFFALCGVAVGLGWNLVFKRILLVAPYYSLLGKACSAEESILQPYAADGYATLLRSVRHGQIFLAVVSWLTIIGAFLPIFLANVPYRKDTTRDAFFVSAWISTGILITMLAVLAVIATALARARTQPPFFTLFRLLNQSPISIIKSLLGDSPVFMGGMMDFSEESIPKSENAICGRGLHYRLVRLGDENLGYKFVLQPVAARSY